MFYLVYIRNVSRNYTIIDDTIIILTIMADHQYMSDIKIIYLSKKQYNPVILNAKFIESSEF